ncbi:protein elav-like [Corticium candelabrum]|uniref:protein elav-like n=1 Tax=Corticium candelabrum TaxID=121492 RepID=UPI002E259697|nr:protein elav-like [Corticium candelabrum]
MAVLGPLTKEEDSLKKKYALLRQKKAELQKESKASVPAKVAKPALKRPLPHRPAEAKETARKVLATEKQQSTQQSGVKASGFKRSKNLEKRLKEQQQQPQYQPWTSLSTSLEKKSTLSSDEQKQAATRYKDLYDNFVPAASRGSSSSGRSQTQCGQRGNTIYIQCRNPDQGLDEESLKQAFSDYGKVVEIVAEPSKGYAFITYNSIESAENAIRKMNSEFVGRTRIRVSFARKQPSLTDAPEETSTESAWHMVGSSLPKLQQQSPAKVVRKQVVYDDDFFMTGNDSTD